jgi:hypothetical protein
MDQELFVVTESMKKIEDRKVPEFLCVKRCRKNDAVGNRARKDFAGESVALDATG